MERYRRLKDLAFGGMGVVELVVREEGAFQRLQARKRLHRRYLGDAELEQMFVEEARLAASIRHPNVVSVHDMGTDDEGPFLIMDYVHGASLATLIKTAESLPESLVVRIIRDVARGLCAAHEATSASGAPLCIVHRDVTPQNVLLSFDDQVLLTDFGIAKAAMSPKTSTGLLKGKSGYFAPEQLDFFPATARTDLFALGIVAWEAFAGRRLYKRETPLETARAIKREAPPDLYDIRPELSPDTCLLVLELLAKSPEERPPSAAEVVERCDAILAKLEMGPSLSEVFRQLDMVTPPPSLETSSPAKEQESSRGSRRRSRALWLICGVLLAIPAALFFPSPVNTRLTKEVRPSAEPVQPAAAVPTADEPAEVRLDEPALPTPGDVEATQPQTEGEGTTMRRRRSTMTSRVRPTTMAEPDTPDCAAAPSWAQVPGCP